jgi:galactose mutarotase-like enzyme
MSNSTSQYSVQSHSPGADSRYVTPAYWLKDEAAGSAIALLPDRGGILTEWTHQGKELFFMDWERYQDPKMSIRGGNPILFPICGNLPDNQYVENGVTYTLAQHGFARNMVWKVVDQNTQDSASITLSLGHTAETLAVYPFEFEAKYTYTLKGNVLMIVTAFTNLSDRPMPFSAGFHPYFPAADKSKLEFSIPAKTAMVDQKTKATQAFANEFDFNQEEIDWCFDTLTGQTATVIDRHANTKLTLKYDAEYSTLVFWTLKGKDFYCLEPWSAARNAMNTGTHLLKLAPGATQTIQFSLTYEAIG